MEGKTHRPYITVRIQIKKKTNPNGGNKTIMMAASEVPHNWDK